MAYGNVERKDLDREFLNYVDEKWKKYERCKKKAEDLDGTTAKDYWVNRAYSYRLDYDIAMHEYEERVRKFGGPKLTET